MIDQRQSLTIPSDTSKFVSEPDRAAVAGHHKDYLVWDGRFQPFHLGHLGSVRAILDDFHQPLVVAVIDSTRYGVGTGKEDPNPHHRMEENPLSFWERLEMIRSTLIAEALDGEVTILGVPRPDLYWPIARSFYPPRRRICITDKDGYERSKAAFWTSMGEEVAILRTKVPSQVSGQLVKQSIRSGEDWRPYLHPATWEYFEEIGGPARFISSVLGTK